jgi:glycosyltransferase involved in cell wall biosynthesis
VSLTTYGRRTATVHLTIESIGRGAARPARLILWLDDADAVTNLRPSLRRAVRRGLEVRVCDDLGPHKKYYPYVTDGALSVRLVTCDDDVMYPRDWLKDLVSAAERWPGCVVCHRAREVQVSGAWLAPYSTWPLSGSIRASPTTLATGVSGVLYPPPMLAELRRRGTQFLSVSPRADDLWLHWVALRAGIPVRQISAMPKQFFVVPGTQEQALFRENVVDSGNDLHARTLYGTEDLELLSDGKSDRDVPRTGSGTTGPGSNRPHRRTIAFLPAFEERFDGTGGAVATWVAAVAPLSSYPTLILDPGVPDGRAVTRSVQAPGWFRAYHRAVRAVSAPLVRLVGSRAGRMVASAMRDGAVWVRAIAPRLGSVDVVVVENRPHYVELLRRCGYPGEIVLHMHNEADISFLDQDGESASALRGVVYCSRFLASRSSGGPGSLPAVVVHNGIEDDLTVDGGGRSGILFAGRMVHEKGPDVAIEAWRNLWSQGIRVPLTLVGGTAPGTRNPTTRYLRSLRRSVRECNDEAGREWVRLLEPRPRAEVLRMMRGAEYFLYPCRWQEPFGMVVLEAIASGCVCVTSRVGGIGEILDATGLAGGADLVLDAQAAAERISAAMSNVASSRREADLAAAAVRRAFSWERVARDFDSAIAGLVDDVGR